MSWPTVQVESWEAFERRVAQLARPLSAQTAYLLRGQADSTWTLKPSINRLLPDKVTVEQALQVESLGLQQFKEQAHLHLRSALLPSMVHVPGAQFIGEWWALMQHHYAPTRLLDWTLSPYVALYFAVEREFDKDGAVYLVHRHTIEASYREYFADRNSISEKQLQDPQAKPALFAWSPARSTERFVAQQGYFTVATNLLADQGQLIVGACTDAASKAKDQLYYSKWVVPATLKPSFLRRLRMMNIAAHSLFPGIDGLGRSLAESARLASTHLPST